MEARADVVRGVDHLGEIGTEVFDSFRARMLLRISEMLDFEREKIMAAEDPLVTMARAHVEWFISNSSVVGEENIPTEGGVVIASNHAFGPNDMTMLVAHLASPPYSRHWGAVGNSAHFNNCFPNWQRDSRFANHIIPVNREGGEIHGKVSNGRQVINSAVQFLQSGENPLLFVNPEAASAMYRNRIGKALPGFSIIAERAGVPIVPVLFTGAIDVETLKFDVHCKILPAMESSSDHKRIMQQWSNALDCALGE